MPKRSSTDRPTFTLNAQIHQRVMKLVLAGVPIKLVYGLIGCRAQNVLEWMADGQKEQVRREKNEPVERGVLAMTYLDNAYRFYTEVSAAVDTLTAKLSTVPVHAAIKGKDWHAAKWLLERRAPDIFDGKAEPDGDHEDDEEKIHIYMPDNGRGPHG